MQPLVDIANIPAFLGKLWKMVNDPATDHLICWSQTGNSFIIQNQAQFWYELLPLYYKHNNMSSFVRQLNMYGFHKISTVENGSMDTDKDEIQFYHPFFQKDQPEKLKNIKRKGTATTKSHESSQGIIRHDDLTKVLTDVKQLRGRQSSVDSQLSAMKQENAVLWRELALLRQKHMKQQQIVNKLIQFLVTLVQPTASTRMGVGVKRRMPLMLHESPNKRNKGRKTSSGRQPANSGPTIHELDNEIEISPEELLEEGALNEEVPLINSPVASTASVSSESSSKAQTSPLPNQNVSQSEGSSQETLNADFLWDKPEFVNIDDPADVLSDNEEDLINTLQSSAAESNEKIFLNPNNRDTLIGNLISSGNYNVNPVGGKNITNSKKQTNGKQINNTAGSQSANMQVVTKNNQVKISTGLADKTLTRTDHVSTPRTNECFREDLDLHLDSTQSELDQLKDILNGCSTFDANALLGLFDHDPEYGIRSTLQNKENPTGEAGDPLVSGSELTPANNLIDFTDFFDDSLNSQDNNLTVTDSVLLNTSTVNTLQNTSLDTPLIVKNEPLFPSST